MSITLVTPTLAKIDPRKTYTLTSFYSANVSGGETILAAHATKPHYIEEIQIAIDADIVVDIGDGLSSNDVETKALQFIGTATGLVHPLMSFKNRPIVLTAAKAITIDATATGAISGYILSYTVK